MANNPISTLYASFGGNELWNAARIAHILRTAPCSCITPQGDTCDDLPAAMAAGGLGGGYSYETIAQAPWADPDVPAAMDFYGFHAESVTEALNATRSASRISRVRDGETIGRTRRGGKTLRVRGILMGRSLEALEYGLAWLTAATTPGACGQHGTRCGLTDLTWLADCPEPQGGLETDEEYWERAVVPLQRYLHDVKCISGPIVRETYKTGDCWIFDVEMTFASERAFVYKMTRPVALPPVLPAVIEDVAYNLVPFPSAELASGTDIVATNYSTNPSVEVNAAGWSTFQAAPVTSAMLTSGRSTEIAAHGSASFRVVFTPTVSGSGGWFSADQVVLINGVPNGRRFSINMWAAAFVFAGSPDAQEIRFYAFWQTAAGASLRTDLLGIAPSLSGYAVSATNIEPPPAAERVTVRAELRLGAFAPGDVIRLYADALAVTSP